MGMNFAWLAGWLISHGLIDNVNFYQLDFMFVNDCICYADMDTNNPAVFVNGELLSQYVGRRVRALFQIVRDEGGVLIGQSTDNRQITIRGSLSFPVSHFVEVIGIADGNQAIRAEICTDFGEKAGMIWLVAHFSIFVNNVTAYTSHFMASLSITHLTDNFFSFVFQILSLIIMYVKWQMENLRVSLFRWIPLVLMGGYYDWW